MSLVNFLQRLVEKLHFNVVPISADSVSFLGGGRTLDVALCFYVLDKQHHGLLD